MQRRGQKVIAIYFHKHNIGVCLLETERIRIQCSQIRSLCCLGYPIIRDKVAQCQHLITNNFNHELFKNINSQTIQLTIASDKSYDRDSIEMNLARISQHLTTASNLKAYFQLYANNHCKFYALGMMLNYVLREHSNSILRQKIFIEDIDYFNDTLFEILEINKSTMEFLEISKEDLHPSLIKGKGASKEGYSVLSAYEAFMCSTGSKKILRYIFMNPTYNTHVLQQRWALISWMKKHMSQPTKYQKHFKNVHVMQAIVKKFGRNNAEQEDEWKRLMKTLQAMLQLRRLLILQDMPHLVQQYVNHQSWDEIISIFDIFTNTLEFDPLAIRHGVDSTLDQLKKTYDNMPHMLTLIAREQEWDLDFRIVFMTQVGYLVKINSEIELPQNFDSEDWLLQFSNCSGKYYSNSLTQSLDNDYGDVYGQIQDIQKKIIFDLQTMIVEREDILVELYWKLCEIQCFWGVSQLSKSMCQPKISSQALIVSNGWHMLLAGDVIHNHSFTFCQSQAPKNFIYNSEQNLVNTNYSNRCTIITGPNAAGKTVYMKQQGLIVYLAHLGFYVPAALAEVPLCDSIKFIGKTESIYNEQKCGLEGELKSLSSIMQPNVISNKTLILIDQIGAQIDYENSLKLLYATVDYLSNKELKFLTNKTLSKKNDQFTVPITIIVTHLSEILRGSILEQNYLVRFLTMSVEECGLRLFKIKPGLVAKGYGIKAAAEILPPSVIAASQKFMRLITKL